MVEHKVFLSYSSADLQFADRLRQDIEAYGIRVLVDTADIAAGESLVGTITELIGLADSFLVVMSPDSIESSWVETEIMLARHKQITGGHLNIIPMMYRTCVVPSMLQHLRYADFRPHYDAALQDVFKSLRRRIAS